MRLAAPIREALEVAARRDMRPPTPARSEDPRGAFDPRGLPACGRDPGQATPTRKAARVAMASVRKRGKKPGSGWSVKWRDALGETREVSTAARTKAEAKIVAGELQDKVRRQVLGLEPIPADCRTTLSDLCERYVSTWCAPSSREPERYRLAKHLQAWPIGKLRLPAVTTAAIEEHLTAIGTAGLGANSINHIRAALRSMFNHARRLSIWTGSNPANDTLPRKVTRRVYDTLSADDGLLLLANVPPDWRNFFAAALFLGLRKGECAGLRKSDVRVNDGTLTIRASYDRDTTKGRHADVVPIPPPLLPIIEDSLRTKGPFLFPNPDGSMRAERSAPQLILRRALCRAGLVLGWDHICRRCKAAGRSRPHLAASGRGRAAMRDVRHDALAEAGAALPSLPRSAPHRRNPHAQVGRRRAPRATHSAAPRRGHDHAHLRSPRR